jgi:acyl-CoA dehydrogenase
LDFLLSDEQKQIQRSAREFARKVVAPIARECDDKEDMPRAVFEKAFDDGLITGVIPREYGGLGWTAVELVLMVEEIAAACCGMATSLFVHYLPLEAILQFGSEEQRRAYVTPVCERLTLVSFAATDASSGQDIVHSATRATRRDGAFHLTGEKQYITNASWASTFVVIARTDDPPNEQNPSVSMFLVPRDTPGVSIGPPVKKLGQRASNTASVFFDDALVPEANLLGKEGNGLLQGITALMKSRTMIAAMGVGVARAALELAIETGQRRRWRRPLLYHEHYMLRLGRMETEIAAARLLTLRSAWELARGNSDVTHASRAKMFAANVAMETASEALEMLGGMGYTREMMSEKLLRDAKLLQIFEGPTTMQQRIVGTSLVMGDVKDWLRD